MDLETGITGLILGTTYFVALDIYMSYMFTEYFPQSKYALELARAVKKVVPKEYNLFFNLEEGYCDLNGFYRTLLKYEFTQMPTFKAIHRTIMRK